MKQADTSPIIQLGHGNAGLLFEIHTMEWIEQNRWEQNNLAHRHNYFAILWVKSGHGFHYIDLDKYSIENNTVYCISPGQVHLFKTEGPTSGYVISFTPDFLGSSEENCELLFHSGLFNTYGGSTVLEVSPILADELEDVIRNMEKEFKNFFLLRSEILKGFLRILLIYLTRQFTRPAKNDVQSRHYELVRKFTELVDRNFTTRRMVTDYASELVVTPNYLNEVVKKITGFSASHHIQQRIILEAKRQATYSNATLKEIGYELGFDDTAHFSKFFKNVTGVNFTDYKKSAQLQ